MATATYTIPRPNFSRQRSNSLPVLGLLDVSAEEATVLLSAAERATSRRRRPVSVDSPGPVVHDGYGGHTIVPKHFNFSTPSRYGLESSPLRNRVSSTASLRSAESDDQDVTPKNESKPLPALPRSDVRETPAVVVRSPSHSIDAPPSPPISPRRQVPNPSLKAYADGLFSFTQSRLYDAAPQNFDALGLAPYFEGESPPPTPELEEEVSELSPQRPLLRSYWSATSAGSDDEEGGASGPFTPDEESGMMSPDAFFSENTPRVTAGNRWATLSSARPSSHLESPIQPIQPTSTSTVEAFSYFTGFDSVTAATETRFSQALSPIELLQSPYTPSHSHPPSQRSRNSNIVPRSRPSSSASYSTPFYQVDGRNSPFAEMKDLSRPPSWLVRAIG